MLTNTWRIKNRATVAVLTACRRDANLTQRELVALLPAWLKWNQSTLANAELGQRRVDTVEIMEIAKALKIDPETMLGRIARWK